MLNLFRPLAVVCILAAGPAIISPSGQPFLIEQAAEREKPAVRRKVRKAMAAAPARYRRSRGAQAKPKKRSNRLHMSKRVRRKHRRAA